MINISSFINWIEDIHITEEFIDKLGVEERKRAINCVMQLHNAKIQERLEIFKVYVILMSNILCENVEE